ncbi:MAG: LysM peptidoglycan-binding domain-containing protein [Chthoniobacteraceae bacterium]
MWFAAAASAQESPPTPDSTVEAEIREIRQLIEQQNRQLDALSRQFRALKDFLTSEGAIPPGTGKPGAASAGTTGTSAPNASAAPQTAGAVTGTAPAANIAPTATAAGKHTGAKGETLTSIAKRYNIPLAELEKANPIQNDRMLQIGQTLTIPSPNAPAPAAAPTSPKAPEPPTQKKENP